MVTNGAKIKTKVTLTLGAIASVAVALGMTTTSALSQSSSLIQVDGSSTVFPIAEAMAEEFMLVNDGVNITIGISGTGGGFQKFCTGETEISNASRPIKEEEMELCRENGIEYIELPVAYDALTVVINPANTWATTMTTDELRMIWEPSAQGTITQWNQIRQGWPQEPLILYGPGTDSGTFDYFTEAIVGEAGDSRADFTASEDDNVLVQGVLGDDNALGYFGFAYYIENQDRLRAVSIDSGNGPVAPSPETVNNGTYAPLSRPLFIYINAEAAERSDVQDFVGFYLDAANRALISEVGYVPLPDEAYDAAMDNFNDRKVGTVFQGRDTIGVAIADLLELESSR